MEKKLIERNLKFTDKYTYLGITRGSVMEGQFCTCDNCGKLITNMVEVVRHSDRKHFSIGTDCAETLSKAKTLYNNGTSTDFYNDLYCYNNAARFITELNAGCSITDSNVMYTYCINRKGKKMECYTSALQKWFPEILEPA
jgi:hypothetical protein